MALLISVARNAETKGCSGVMVYTEASIEDDDAFVEMSYAYTNRTIEHLLREQKAEMALLANFSLDEGKTFFMSPPSVTHHRFIQQRTSPLNLVSLGYPQGLRFHSHTYYVYALKRIII